MKRHLSYLNYVLRHKWFVLLATIRIRGSVWRAIFHDVSKFTRVEWFPYAETFYEKDGSKRYAETTAFNLAWLKHQHRNQHHWQHWVLRMDDGGTVPLEIPYWITLEMVADWMGAGRAITGRWETENWYRKNSTKILLHPITREIVENKLYGFRK